MTALFAEQMFVVFVVVRVTSDHLVIAVEILFILHNVYIIFVHVVSRHHLYI